MTLQLTPALEQRLDQLAVNTQRSPSELAQEGVEAFLDYEERAVAIIARGRADAAAGRIVAHEDVVARFAGQTHTR